MYYGRKLVIKNKPYWIDSAFKSLESTSVSFSVFRMRLKTYEKKLNQHKHIEHDKKIFDKAANYSSSRWMQIIGIGRAKPFLYTGHHFTKHIGKTFLSMPHFLEAIKKIHLHKLVQGRLKQKMPIDLAVLTDKCRIKDGTGDVYLITNQITKEQYVGLTEIGVQERFKQHCLLTTKVNLTYLINQSIRKYGQHNFSLETIEANIPVENLPNLERHYISYLNTRTPMGLNVTMGGELGCRHGIACELDGMSFKSITEAGRYKDNSTNGMVKAYVAERCIRENKPIPKQSRKRSNHKDAGSPQFRRHKSLMKKDVLCDAWKDYDTYKKQAYALPYSFEYALIIYRADKTRPYGQDNFIWCTRAEERARESGEKYTLDGKIYWGLAKVARRYGIKETTLRNRVKNMGLSINEAVYFKRRKAN
jgi:group I intron endonuclease